MSAFLQTAVAKLTSAVERDNANDYQSALELYREGIQYLLTSLKYQKQDNVKQAIKTKITKYLDRAEQLHAWLDRNNNEQNQPKQFKIPQETNSINCKSEIDIDAKSVALVHGFCRETEKLLLSFQCLIPEGISHLIFSYFYLHYFHKHLLLENPKQKLENIIGVKTAIERCKESIILPLWFPQLFKGSRTPYTGLLLFGPRGCGKSALIRAVVAETLNNQKYKKVNAKCYSVSMPKLMQALRDPLVDDTSMMIRHMFQITDELQQEDACLILWLDEIHKLFARSTAESDSDSDFLRRSKTEFLIQLQNSKKKKFLIIAETNEPWHLDCVFRRRLEKRIYVGLPTKEDRIDMLKKEIQPIANDITEEQYNNLGEQTQGFSGQEIDEMIVNAMKELMRNMNAGSFHEVMLNADVILKVLMDMKPMNGEEYLKQMEVWKEDFGY